MKEMFAGPTAPADARHAGCYLLGEVAGTGDRFGGLCDRATLHTCMEDRLAAQTRIRFAIRASSL